MRDPPRLYCVLVRIWGASKRTHSSLLRHGGQGVGIIRLLGWTEPKHRDAAGNPRMADFRDRDVVGSARGPRSSFFAFPEYSLYSHSVDFLPLLLLLLHVVECSLAL